MLYELLRLFMAILIVGCLSFINNIDYNHKYVDLSTLKNNIRIEKVLDNKSKKVVTAYNLVEWQTDSTPEIGSCNINIKDLLDKGVNVCAGNYKCGTGLMIENYGYCIVLDSLSDKYKDRVDIAMDKLEEANLFGKQVLWVEELNN